MFEVVDQVLAENWDKMESSLDNVQKLRAQLRGELEDLHQVHKDESDASAQKRMKKEMEWKWKDLKGLEATISKYESCLRGDREDDPSILRPKVPWLLPL